MYPINFGGPRADPAYDRRVTCCAARDALDLVSASCVWASCPRRGSHRRRSANCRELVRYRAKAVRLRWGLKVQVHGVMGKEGILPGLGDMFGPRGQKLLDEMHKCKWPTLTALGWSRCGI